MATSTRKLDNELRQKWFSTIVKMIADMGEDVLVYKSNELCFPTTDSENNDKYIQIVVKVPTGSRDGEDFDGYAMREAYELNLKEKEEKRKADAEKKAKKIAKDKKKREG